ncbi:probable isoprenylcysteine alpha-carbonyl methylesterase icmel2 [Phtheirospermum japonicum]|uniref:protein-S-isoprenylcysteine alpha-carbonyl methylesterase n=1 Tax=Phtheirospermum japonicum TaxID=374723 RepID=A0A830CXI7_9LAMI|nr:probable isoprenylcysteine alpha-carbonyl methylesterase icmel2 [Phtheirospermum japonicum]
MEATLSLPANFPSVDSINEMTEETESDTLVRVSSFPLNQQRRRRVGNKTASFASRPRRQQSFGHAAAETYLLTRLSFKLLSYLGVGYRWMTRLLALAVYATLLMPGFLQEATANLLSVISFQAKSDEVSFMEINQEIGVNLFIGPGFFEYLNFPQGTISDMANDVSQGIEFVCNNIIEFGGDPNKIYLMGQSAGAHISSFALFQQAVKESRDESISWSDPLRGGKDELFDYLIGFIHAGDKEALARDAMAPPRRRYVPEILLRLAGRVSPF